MFAVMYRKGAMWVPSKVSIFLGPHLFDPQNAVFVKLFSSKKSSSPGVCRNDSERSFTLSYLINSCRLSPEDALSVAEQVRIKSSKNPDAVLELLRKYGFSGSDIVRLVNKLPSVLRFKPEKNLLPKLEFFCSIGIPHPVLADILSFNPTILRHSLKSSIIPWYNTVKGVVRSDERVGRVLVQTRVAFKSIPAKIGLLRKLGLPESNIASFVQRSCLAYNSEERLAACVDRAVKMGIDKNRTVFIKAIEVFSELSESTLKNKMDVYRRCGWSESDIDTAFSKFPFCMKYSEKKIMANMGFLVNKMGLTPASIARCPMLTGYSLEKRMKPRYLVAKMLDEKGLKKMPGALFLVRIGEELFLEKYIVPYESDIPKLLDIYQGRLSHECA